MSEQLAQDTQYTLMVPDIYLYRPAYFSEDVETTFIAAFQQVWAKLPDEARTTLQHRWKRQQERTRCADDPKFAPIVELYHDWGMQMDCPSAGDNVRVNLDFPEYDDHLFFEVVCVQNMPNDVLQAWIAQQLAHCYLRATGLKTRKGRAVEERILGVTSKWGFTAQLETYWLLSE